MAQERSQTYRRALELAEQIETLYAEVEEHRAWFRSMEKVGPNVPLPAGRHSFVNVDRVFCALAIKAATTHRAVRILCEAGDGDSAASLSRVVLENGVLMRWLLEGPGHDRLQTYVLFLSVLHEKTIAVVEKYFNNHPELVDAAKAHSDEYHRAVARAVFGGNDNTWAYFPSSKGNGKLVQIRIAQMCG